MRRYLTETVLNRWGAALSAGDIAGVADCWEVPALDYIPQLSKDGQARLRVALTRTK